MNAYGGGLSELGKNQDLNHQYGEMNDSRGALGTIKERLRKNNSSRNLEGNQKMASAKDMRSFANQSALNNPYLRKEKLSGVNTSEPWSI